MPIAAQLAAAILGTSLLESDRGHVAELETEAAMMNEALRELEARKMDQTISALKYAEAIIGSVVQAAAMEAATSMDKTSMGLPLAGIAGAGAAAKRGLGGAAQAAGRLLPSVGLKTKLIGGAALAGTAYAGYKGLQATRDYMKSQPHGTYGSKGPAVMNNVNEFGYPEY